MAFDLTAGGSQGDDFLSRFDAAEAPKPLPGGPYLVSVRCGEMAKTRAGDDAYRVTWEVIEPAEFAGSTVRRIFAFSPKAIGYAKRDLAILGITTSKQLLEPFPPTGKRIVCRLLVALQRLDDGRELNDVKSFAVVRIEDVPPHPFAVGDAWETPGGNGAGTDFPFGGSPDATPKGGDA